MEQLNGQDKYFDLGSGRFASALWLDNAFPKKIRRQLARFLNILIILALGAFFALSLSRFIRLQFPFPIETSSFKDNLIDFVFLILAFRLTLFSLESFYRSKSTNGEIIAQSSNIADYLNFEAASLLAKTDFRWGALSGANILNIFSESEVGRFVFSHLGILAEDFKALLEKIFPSRPPQDDFPILIKKIFDRIATKDKNEIAVSDIIIGILETNEQIFKFFFELKLKKEDVAGALEWASEIYQKLEKISYWWREENLARIQGIAKDWAYGATYLLDKFSRSFAEHHPVTEHRFLHFTGHQKEIEEMEAILSREAQANVLIVGEPGVGKRTVIAGFDDMINTGRIRPELEYKRILELDAPSLIAAAKTKGALEDLLIRIFNDAVKAGNIILTIDNFADFLNSSTNLGVSLLQILGPYLQSSDLQIIALSDSGDYKRFLEPDSSLMQYFELIRVEEPTEEELFHILEDVALELESSRRAVILYQAIKEAMNASMTYLTEGALPERAIDILETVSSQVRGREDNVLRPADISAFVSMRTKMPLGVLKPEEKERLLNLEEVLHRRVVDQEEAISAISSAVRRVRAGLQETKKPLASFLFLGPTGVGKTETAKTLSEIYFGSEEAMSRFDMSEYQNENGLERLIGSFERNEPGLLATKLREKPYGLLLLDEFEKCHIKIRDLFLQILDEGFFTDAFGKKVFTRNNIIIATSNAASQLIWEMGKKGIDPATLKDAVIDVIQKQGIFKAELLNRFDGVVIFHHLTREHLKAIARIMLEKLKKRLKNQKEIDLVINDFLMEKVAEIGYDPLFGARPMQRAISDHIEKKIAEWLISGKIDRGAKIEFTVQDLEGI